jgi:arsenite methyltransferase
MLEIKEAINNRYSAKSENEYMGCANLKQFYDIKKGNTVLDLGCGNGNQTIKLCEIVGENGFIYGLDITESMLKKANSQINTKNIKFILGDINKIPLENNSVDVVISNCVINHSPDKRKVYNELYRILKIDGHFLIGDVMSVNELPEEVSNNPENIADCWGGAILKEKYFEIIKDAGFKNILELSKRQYYKKDFLLESIIIKGVKK